jgi:hypothetical protein
VGNYAVVSVRFNESSPLNLLLDSGFGPTLLTEIGSEDSVVLRYTSQTTLKGLGVGTPPSVLISEGNTLRMGSIKLPESRVLVLEEDLFHLSRQTGTRINGILGAELFESFVVHVQYSKKRIALYTPGKTPDWSTYQAIPLRMDGQKMYMDAWIEAPDHSVRTVRLLVDTGAELAAWFRSYGNTPIPLPQRRFHGYIGKGLNGEIEGYYGRIARMGIGPYTLTNPIVSFPDSASIADILERSERDGSLGCQILSRFDVVFDTPAKTLYLRPNKSLNAPFTYNVSGLEIVQHESGLNVPEVWWVRRHSPGDTAGILPGDLLLEVDGYNGFTTPLSLLRSRLERPKGSVRLVVLRNGKTLNVRMRQQAVL